MDGNRLLSDVSSKYGAPMGRSDITDNPEAKCRLFRVELYDGGYDRGGAYWGTPEHEALYCAMGDDFQVFQWAKNRQEARELLLERFPDLKLRKIGKEKPPVLPKRILHNQDGWAITYDAIMAAMPEATFPMSCTGGLAKICIDVLNQGIDAHLEACMMPDRGDSYRVDKSRVIPRLFLEFSKESLPVFLRRMFETENEEAVEWAENVLDHLGFSGTGEFVGSEEGESNEEE